MTPVTGVGVSCSEPGCPKPIWAEGKCLVHWKLTQIGKTPR